VAWLAVVVAGAVLVTVGIVAMRRPDTKPTNTFGDSPASPAGMSIDYAGTAPTPAAPVPGAVRGGVITVQRDVPFDHLDPARIYSFGEMSAASLMHRGLTGYLGQSGEDGPKLVGDLATNAGQTTDGGRTWTYHLRPGLKFSDGTPITSADVAYGISRSFTPAYSDGLPYLQNLLDPSHVYKGPTASRPLAPGVSTPDGQTIVIGLPVATMTLPLLLALVNTVPVPKAKDTRQGYDTAWVSSGPYRLKESKPTRLTLERNPSWDPTSDPIRSAYPDWVVFEFDGNRKEARIVNGAGADATLLMTGSFSPALIGVVRANSDASVRVRQAAGPFMRYVAINVARVRDLRVRQALNHAIDRDAIVNIVGGPDIATPATTILAPVVPGHRSFDLYPAGAKGDPGAAKARLAGAPVGRLKLCLAGGSTEGLTIAHAIEASLERAGFTIDVETIPADTFYPTISGPDTSCDLMAVGWGADYPDGYATLGELFNGARLGDPLGNNYSHLDPKVINDRLGELAAQADRSMAAAGYGELDEMIMRDYVPVIPLFNFRVFEMFGKNVGNAVLNTRFGTIDLTGVYVNG
jgi:peptide/nickel transport system substrate-binding protein